MSAVDDPDISPLDFLLLAIYDAREKNVLSDATADLLGELFVEYLIAPHTGETLQQRKGRASNLGQSSFQFLIATLRDADDEGVLSDAATELLAGLFIEYLIAPHTGETAEEVRERLRERPENTCAGLVASISASWDDCAALVALYESTNGDNWTENTNWLSDKPLGLWHGVVTDGDGSVIELDLGDNHLVGEIPPELGRLSNLRVLILWRNQLSGYIPLELGNLSSLTHIFLPDNQLTGCFPEALEGIEERAFDPSVSSCEGRAALVALYEATDGDNWIDNTNWLSNKPIGEWYGVEIYDDAYYTYMVVGLKLSRNGLSGEIPAELGELIELESLSLWGNQLSGQIPPEIGRLYKLQRLYLHANNLSGQIPLELAYLTKLESLFIGGNRFDGCVPDSLGDILDSDLSALGLPFCASEVLTPLPTLTLAALSLSPTEVTLTWSPVRESVSLLEIYRNGELIATLTPESGFYIDDGLSPNTLYGYQIEIMFADGSLSTALSDATTLADPRVSYTPMNVSEDGFKLAIVDFLNPPNTEYRLEMRRLPLYEPNQDQTAYVHEEQTIIQDWSASKCLTLEFPQTYLVILETIASRNSKGIESLHSEHSIYGHIYLQKFTSNDDPWTRQKIEDASDIYDITDQARSWILSDIPVKGRRNEPGYGGYNSRDGVSIGYPVHPTTLMHEIMHGFWENWDEFTEPCDEMNIYTFRRDVARFMLDFKEYDQAEQPNPWEDWRPFYNYLVGISANYSSSDGRDTWELLEQGDYDELWDALYHPVDPEIPNIAAGKLSLIPPLLRSYFTGFLAAGEETKWSEELVWYSSLPYEERRLWDIAYNYHSVLAFSPEYAAPSNALATSITPQIRERLRNADRRILIDFINTLEDISCNTESPCRELWRADFDFWTGYVAQNLYRAKLYLEELSPSVGIELEQSNLDAVRAVLRILVSDVSSCGQTSISALRESVNSISGISELQRAALLAMIEVRERNGHWNIPCN